MKLYFERFDGQAVTCDDFAQSIADANPNSELTKHLTQFKRWYSQSGTPRVEAVGDYDESSQTYTLTFKQHVKAGNEPYVIPVSMGLLDREGHALPLQLEAEANNAQHDVKNLGFDRFHANFQIYKHHNTS